MLSIQLQKRFSDIVVESVKMVHANVDAEDLGSGVNYAAIYARSQEDFDAVTQELNSNGKVVLKRPTGDYYLLQGPLRMQETLITHCRVRIFAADHIEQGYVDFEVKNYQRFKEKYLSRSYFSIVDSGKEMIRLKDPKFAVRAYFPSGNFRRP